ncbi:MAG: DUF202 domain-containing protein [Armatimonadetes bacterium]|nr:DUF202 domain-containing protein [Armatimonadota bacterium]
MSDPSPRDHLANERTFLAWVRTSIALMGFGVVIAKLRFLTLDTDGVAAPGGPPAGTRSTELGLAFAAVGLVTLLFSLLHYEQSRRAIERGDYQAPRRTLYVFVAVIFLLGLACVLYLLTLTPH